MSFRDLSLIVTILGLLPVCFFRPWIGVLVWAWIGLMNPHRLTWGLAYSMPFAMLVAIATLGGLVFTSDRRPLPRTRELYILIALWGVFVLSTFQALYPLDAWDYLSRVSKILLMTFVSLLLLQDEKKLRAFVWVIALSLGYFGLKGGLWALATGGHAQVLGPPDSFIGDNTGIGLALNMTLPLLVFLRREESRRWLRSLLSTILVFSAIAVIFTYSRGAFLGLAAVLFMLMLKSRWKFATAVFIALTISLAPTFIPDQWFERMQTIETYEKDQSAVDRLNAWYIAYHIALDYPLFGAGFRPFTPETSRHYLPTTLAPNVDAHSIFFQVLAEHGFTGLVLYAWLIIAVFVDLASVIRRTRGDPSREWMERLAQMLQVSLVAYVVNGLFLSLSYFDLFYYLVAVTMILEVLARQPSPARAGQATTGVGRIELVRG